MCGLRAAGLGEGAGGITRRDLLLGGAAAVLLAGCGGSGNVRKGETSGSRTIDHEYGKTTIDGSPERIVSVGYTDHDPILALGMRPVGIRRWFGNPPRGVWPWARDVLGDARPRLLPENSINYEQVAALKPDLIVGISSGMNRKDYDVLSEFAPTLPQSGGWPQYGVPWQEQTLVIGRALGREQKARELVANLEERFEQTRREHPEFEGATVSVIGTGSGAFYLYSTVDRSVAFFTALGFRLPAPAARIAPKDRYYVQISEERLGVADADVLICFCSSPADERRLRSSAVFRRLGAVRDGRTIYLSEDDDLTRAALSFDTVLSHPYLLEHLVPKLSWLLEKA
ncbi:MAG: iron-siderophore ABC transporter substrate-binding protein [Rubrobacteraceae bacterium]|nr:iron-siderophore ABC transporter substrate-binding protein [Rubrobacteraceae bacterium]